MDAAAKLFIAKGVDATTVDEIVADAEVAKGTFYLYFSSKNDLLLALRERFVAGFMQRIRTAVDASPEGDWAARLRSWTRAGIDAYLDEFELHDVVFHAHGHHQRYPKERSAVVDHLSRLLTEGAKAGAWSIEDPRLAAIVLYQGLHGAVDEAILAGGTDRARLARRLSNLFLRMLGAPEEIGRRTGLPTR